MVIINETSEYLQYPTYTRLMQYETNFTWTKLWGHYFTGVMATIYELMIRNSQNSLLHSHKALLTLLYLVAHSLYSNTSSISV